MTSPHTVYIVHCVDTEGPLFESLEATFDRLRKTFGIEADATAPTLERLRRGLDVPEHLSVPVRDFLSRTRYNTTWGEVDSMLDEIFSDEWRARYRDDAGRPYTFGWFILDHVGFVSNPRRRSLGYHSVYDHYRQRLACASGSGDRLYWHFHPVSYFREANKTSNGFSVTNEHLRVLCRRLIDRLDFPVAFRPGSHVVRPDINLFLEMWVPFDFGNQGMPERAGDRLQNDMAGGRYGDWRRATSEWETYHPDFYDYQAKGGMRRFVSRCLNLDARVRPVTREEVDAAFRRAASGRPTILAVTSHDEREMRTGIEWFMRTVKEVRSSHPGVAVVHANPVEAVRATEGMLREPPPKLSTRWEGTRLFVNADKELWGPQPFFCFKTHGQDYIHENLDRQDGDGWCFTFDEDTVRLDQLESIGLASHDRVGNTSVYRLSPDRDPAKTASRHLNEDWPV